LIARRFIFFSISLTLVFKRLTLFNPWLALLTYNISRETACRNYYMGDSWLLENSSKN